MEGMVVHDTGAVLRDQLLQRRRRLEAVLEDAPEAAPLARLLEEVDVALARFERGTFGICDVCHGAIEPDRIQADPLVRTCLSCLTPSEQRALERDLDLARRVQQTLLPPQTFRIDGWEAGYDYQPVGSASGDYVDLIPLDSGDLLFMIGDVSGKGIAASLVMSHLHAIVRSLIALGLPFQEIVERTNRIFYESVGGNQYATLVCGKARRGGDIELSNAGHCPPVVVRDGTAHLVPPTSVPIGLFAGAPFPTVQLKLGVGETLMIYTDGFSEAIDAAGEQYGHERAVDAIVRCQRQTIPELISNCLADLARFRGDEARHDDQTVFLLRRIG